MSTTPDNTETLLRAILSVTARQAFPPERLAEIVAPRGTSGDSQLQAYNMCDGTKGQGEVAKATKIDPGSFSRTVARWIEAGVMFRLGEGRDAKLLHAYPLARDAVERERAR